LVNESKEVAELIYATCEKRLQLEIDRLVGSDMSDDELGVFSPDDIRTEEAVATNVENTDKEKQAHPHEPSGNDMEPVGKSRDNLRWLWSVVSEKMTLGSNMKNNAKIRYDAKTAVERCRMYRDESCLEFQVRLQNAVQMHEEIVKKYGNGSSRDISEFADFQSMSAEELAYKYFAGLDNSRFIHFKTDIENSFAAGT
jgi:hypothetical protein